MTRSLLFKSVALAGMMTCTFAVAQTRYCIGGDLDHLSATEKAACNTTMEAVRSAASSLHAPDGWHFVVVCGEEGWKNYAAFSTTGATDLETAAADTDRDQQTTFLREASLHTNEPHGLQRAVAHEVASILLNTHDEPAIVAQMAAWERESRVQQASLVQ